VTDTDALLCLPDRDTAKLRLAAQIPALEPGVAAILPRADRRGRAWRPGTAPPPGTEPGARPGSGMDRIPAVGRDQGGPGNATVSSIYLAAEDGTPLPVAQAGLYITLRVADAGQPAPVRSYSLSSPPGAAQIGSA
jgi:hypothetical protein